MTQVSAVIPVHNGELYLAEAVASVLAQTAPVLECIVVDDGSTDASAEIARGFGDAVTYLRQTPRRGVSAARNRGVAQARGELVAFLDHDDVWRPAKLERQTALLEQQSATLVLCGVEVIDRHGAPLGTRRLASADLMAGMLLFNGTETVSASSTGLFDRAALVALGGFDERLGMSADWDVLMRVLLGGRLAYVDEPLVQYRRHDTNMSRQVAPMEHDMRLAFAKTFADPRLPEPLRRRRREAYGRLFRMLAGSYRDSGRRRDALRTLARSAAYDPAVIRELIGRRPGRRPPGSAASRRR
jgi:glycosyltransferase involved in cell wall biosynthesis